MADDSSTPAIELDHVSCRFISADGKATLALQDFSMTVERGQFCAVVGPTGCGKSTTLSLITGLLKPTTGRVRVMGQPVDGIDPRIGFVFQNDAIFPWRNVIDNVSAGHARQLADRVMLSPKSTRNASGFEERDAPSDIEYIRMAGIAMGDPYLATYGMADAEKFDWEKIGGLKTGPNADSQAPDSTSQPGKGTPGSPADSKSHTPKRMRPAA